MINTKQIGYLSRDLDGRQTRTQRNKHTDAPASKVAPLSSSSYEWSNSANMASTSNVPNGTVSCGAQDMPT